MAFWFWLALGVILLAALVLLLSMSSVRIRVRYFQSGGHGRLTVVVRGLYGLIRYRIEIPDVVRRVRTFFFENKNDSAQPSDAASRSEPNLLRKAVALRRKMKSARLLAWTLPPMMRRGLKKVACTRFRLDFRIGTGDASSTAVLCGLLWTVYGCLVAGLAALVRMKARPHGEVVPEYRTLEFSMVWEADFEFRAGPMLAAALRAMLFQAPKGKILKQWKKWRSLETRPQSA